MLSVLKAVKQDDVKQTSTQHPECIQHITEGLNKHHRYLSPYFNLELILILSSVQTMRKAQTHADNGFINWTYGPAYTQKQIYYERLFLSLILIILHICIGVI